MSLQLASIFWDPDPQAFHILGYPIYWYSLFFAVGYLAAYLVVSHLLHRFYQQKIPKHFLDTAAWYMFIGMIIGARLAHVFFYDWPHYSKNPLKIFYTWEGGLASHGGGVGILLALCFFWYRHKKDALGLAFKEFLDMLVIGVCVCAGFIRVGNFFNQEILGKTTTLPWGVYFGHPVDIHAIQPSHPVQLYEALFYFATGALLYIFYPYLKGKKGALAGVFFISIFVFRFCIEWLKLPQAVSDATSHIFMGQLLSLPFIFLGILLLYKAR